MKLFFLIAKFTFLKKYLLFAIPALIFILWRFREPDYSQYLLEIDPDELDSFMIVQIQRKENILNWVRANKKLSGEYNHRTGMFHPEIPLIWQGKALILQPLAYTLFLRDEVWAAYGEQYKEYRGELIDDKTRNQLENVETVVVNEDQVLKMLNQYV